MEYNDRSAHALKNVQREAERVYQTAQIASELMEFITEQVSGAFLAFSDAMEKLNDAEQ